MRAAPQILVAGRARLAGFLLGGLLGLAFVPAWAPRPADAAADAVTDVFGPAGTDAASAAAFVSGDGAYSATVTSYSPSGTSDATLTIFTVATADSPGVQVAERVGVGTNVDQWTGPPNGGVIVRIKTQTTGKVRVVVRMKRP